MVWILLGVVFVAALGWLANGIRKIGTVSVGPLIGERAGAALVLVDLQTVFWDANLYSGAAKSAALTVILDEIKNAKANGIPVIGVQQEWSIPSTKAVAKLFMKGQAVQGTAGTELAAPFAGFVDHTIVKRVQDGFETGELDKLLEDLEVGKLILVGLDTQYCIAKTALAARGRGYGVEIPKRGVLSANEHGGETALEMLVENKVTLR